MRTVLLIPLLVVAALLAACQESAGPTALDHPIFSGVPADGDGNKLVFDFDIDAPITCSSGEEINRNDFGWAQFWVFGPPNNRNVELGVFHDVITFTNADGETFVWRDVGPDRYYMQDGDLFVAIAGTSTGSGNTDRTETVAGHVVIRDPFGPTAEVVLIAGNEFGNIDDLACDTLT